MKKIHVRSRQWRRHYRKIKALYDHKPVPVRGLITNGISRHFFKLYVKYKRSLWLP